ncbi:GGDEF domain-containing protein [Pelosinus sp. sgz500959]|uniref:GGDEF domain-containing protein n=1 Tax=Pelosinus sp. sgz500959 TaxID=3242472 RepID=UPI0036731384
MLDLTIIRLYLTDIIFLTINILLLHILLTAKRSLWFQGIVFFATGVAVHWLRILLEPLVHDFLLRGFITGPLYLIPCALFFKETFYARVFIFFLIYSLTQFIYLIFVHIDQFLSPAIPGTWVLLGLILEMAALPLIKKYLVPHSKNIITIIDEQNPSFTLFPVLSFVLLAFYGIQGTYSLSTFIPVVLSTMLILFSYYLIVMSITWAKSHQQLEQQRNVNSQLEMAQQRLVVLNQQLDFSARTDSLTGLYNRRHMEQKIQEEYEYYQRTGVEFALIIVDIDLFKGINDKYGHAGGDCLLKLVSEDLKKSVREYDIVARWGGDEFLLLLPATNSEKAVGLAERISKNVEKSRYIYENQVLSVTLTLGVSVIKSDDIVASVIKKADMVMYQGKRAGRNCVISFDSIANINPSGISDFDAKKL